LRTFRKLPYVLLRKVISHIGGWTDRTRPIVRLDVRNSMVTKGYQKGVYERVTKGIFTSSYMKRPTSRGGDEQRE
jgi:hypothetical protein